MDVAAQGVVMNVCYLNIVQLPTVLPLAANLAVNTAPDRDRRKGGRQAVPTEARTWGPSASPPKGESISAHIWRYALSLKPFPRWMGPPPSGRISARAQ